MFGGLQHGLTVGMKHPDIFSETEILPGQSSGFSSIIDFWDPQTSRAHHAAGIRANLCSSTTCNAGFGLCCFQNLQTEPNKKPKQVSLTKSFRLCN